MKQGPAQRRTRQGARAQGNITQITGDVNVQMPPVREPKVEWPIWVGTVPRLAAAFQPRAEAREAVTQARSAGGNVVLSQVLVGDGGVGKSQLAAALARELRDQELSQGSGLDLLVWANATEPDQIITAYADAADRLGLPESASGDVAAAARAFLAWLAATERRWLIVLDDITDPEAVDPWWPDGGHRNGWALATTRRSDALLSGQGRKLIRLDLYTIEEARAYLHRRLTDAGHPHLYDADQAGRLAEELGRLPLALGHAAAYMINKRCNIADYLERFHDTGNKLSDLLPPTADTEGYGRPITTALLVSLNAVQAADITRLARPLLELISLMDPLGHPADLWTTPPVRAHLRTSRPGRRRWLRHHQPAVTEQDIHTALDCLRTYALIAQDTARAPVRVHAVTARAIRETILPEALPAMARTAADAILSLWPELDHIDRDLSAALRANAMLLDQHTSPCLWKPTTHGCVSWVSRSLTAAGLYEQAVEYDQRMLQQSHETHGPDHPDTLSARSNLAVSYRDAGRTQEALELSERVLADRERLLGPDHPDTLSARNNLAVSYSDAGRTQEALELSERVLADRERLLGPDHPDTLTARNNLAASYSDAGRTQEALKLRERVLADRERLLGPDHPDTLTARSNLAASYSDAGRTQEALELDEKVLADRERLLGPDHPDTLSARSNLAASYRDAGRTQEALELRERVLADRERLLGPDHPDTLTARNNLAASYSDAGRTQEALELRERVLADRERLLGPDHPDTLTARNNLAVSYSDAGRTQEALELRERVLADRERLLGPDHPDTLTARNNLAVSYSDAGRTQEALKLRERVLADGERLLGPDHPDTLSARSNLAASYSDVGRTQEALELDEKVLADRERLLGPDHPDTLSARSNLAVSYSDVGRTQEALKLRERVLADRERLLGPDHPATLTARNNLALTRESDGALRQRSTATSTPATDPQQPSTAD
ncbi:tetratricopeptide repeat protein [Streptomyces sp. NPDC004546]|uniref:tetratricopeptide repeat protein n=1 Tax=Streptomyces sp. NPDC004546 TaxID=3154282 RepID=UPI0033AF8DD2